LDKKENKEKKHEEGRTDLEGAPKHAKSTKDYHANAS
jgi:hypothetical protein